MRVTWEDGHESRYAFPFLRVACLCAGCRGHGSKRTEPPRREDELTLAQSTIVDASAVGHYAIHLAWEDGHDTGIYPYSYLRSICPCGAPHEPDR